MIMTSRQNFTLNIQYFINNFKNFKMCILFLASGKFHFIRDRFERLCLSFVERTTVKIHPRPFKILSIRVDERGGVNKWIKFGNKRETWLTLTCSDTCSRISRFLRLLLFHGVLIVDEFYHFWCGLSRRDRTSRRMGDLEIVLGYREYSCNNSQKLTILSKADIYRQNKKNNFFYSLHYCN